MTQRAEALLVVTNLEVRGSNPNRDPFYPLSEEKVGIVLLSGSEVGLENELSRRFEVP